MIRPLVMRRCAASSQHVVGIDRVPPVAIANSSEIPTRPDVEAAYTARRRPGRQPSGGHGPPARRPLRGALGARRPARHRAHRARARQPTAAGQCHRYRDGRRPHRPPDRHARYTDGPLLRAAQARKTPARPLRARRRAGRARPRRSGPAGGADTGTATRARTRVAEARARRGCPRPTAARPDRRADTASRTAPLSTPRGARASPCGASTHARPGPREPADATLARAGRGSSRRPQRARPGLEAVGPPPFVFLSGCRHPMTVTVASGSGDRAPAARERRQRTSTSPSFDGQPAVRLLAAVSAQLPSDRSHPRASLRTR